MVCILDYTLKSKRNFYVKQNKYYTNIRFVNQQVNQIALGTFLTVGLGALTELDRLACGTQGVIKTSIQFSIR